MVVRTMMVMVEVVIVVIKVGDGEYKDIILSHKVGEATPKMMR